MNITQKGTATTIAIQDLVNCLINLLVTAYYEENKVEQDKLVFAFNTYGNILIALRVLTLEEFTVIAETVTAHFTKVDNIINLKLELLWQEIAMALEAEKEEAEAEKVENETEERLLQSHVAANESNLKAYESNC